MRLLDVSAYLRSQEMVVALEHNGCMLLAGHCDAFAKVQVPAKGFLQLRKELDVVRSLRNLPVGLQINSRRSMLELRSVLRLDSFVASSRLYE